MQRCACCKFCSPIGEFIDCTFCGEVVMDCVENAPICEQCYNEPDCRFNFGNGLKICEGCAVKFGRDTSINIYKKIKSYIDTLSIKDDDNKIYDNIVSRLSYFYNASAHRMRAEQKIREIKDRMEENYMLKFRHPYGHVDRHLFQ